MITESVSNPATDGDDEDPVVLLENLRAAPALFTKEEMYDLEKLIHADRDGAWRRFALATLSEPGARILETVQDDEIARAYAQLMRGLSEYDDRLKELKDLMEMAWSRVMVALATREDMRELMAEGAEKPPTARGLAKSRGPRNPLKRNPPTRSDDHPRARSRIGSGKSG